MTQTIKNKIALAVAELNQDNTIETVYPVEGVEHIYVILNLLECCDKVEAEFYLDDTYQDSTMFNIKNIDTIAAYAIEQLEDEAVTFTEYELNKEFISHLEELYGADRIKVGFVSVSIADIEKIDPVAWEVEFNNFVDEGYAEYIINGETVYIAK